MLSNESLLACLYFIYWGKFIATLSPVFNNWLLTQFPEQTFEVECLSGDAGFRQYCRLHFSSHSLIAVNAPPDKSNNDAFIAIATCLQNHGIQAPNVLYKNEALGFFCLSDLGDKLLADSDYQNDDLVTRTYEQAIDTLVSMMSITSIQHYELPKYDAQFVQTELAIFSEWLLSEYLALTLSPEEAHQLSDCFSLLVDNVLEQPTTFMHRDYHSRNIMLVPDSNTNKKSHSNNKTNHNIAVIDFQDAVNGPVTYDIVSLLRDCYVVLPEVQINHLFQYFKESLLVKLNNENQSIYDIDDKQWQRWFDLMGLQRHIKASGIFARLHLRDQKSHYLADIPQTLSYIIQVTAQYPEFEFLHHLVKNTVLPAILGKTQNKTVC